MALDARNLLANVIALFACRVYVFHTLRVDDEKARLFFASIVDTLRGYLIFLSWLFFRLPLHVRIDVASINFVQQIGGRIGY